MINKMRVILIDLSEDKGFASWLRSIILGANCVLKIAPDPRFFLENTASPPSKFDVGVIITRNNGFETKVESLKSRDVGVEYIEVVKERFNSDELLKQLMEIKEKK